MKTQLTMTKKPKESELHKQPVATPLYLAYLIKFHDIN